MKKVIITLLLQIFVSLSNAQAQGSVLNLKTNGNYLYTVQMDNQFMSAPDKHFSISNLAPGNHYLRIYKVRPFHHPKEVFNGYVGIPFNSEVNAVFERSGNFRILNILAFNAPTYNNPYVQTNYNQYPSNQIAPICDAEFNGLMGTLSNINFDSSRLNVAKQVISNKYLSTDQVIRIMNLFSFDSSRLDFAKYAYARTVDRNHFFQTYNSFTFDSSINELSNYIAHFS